MRVKRHQRAQVPVTHWLVWAARELGDGEPFSLVPEDWGWWLQKIRAHDASIGWPEVPRTCLTKCHFEAPFRALSEASAGAAAQTVTVTSVAG